MKPLQQFHRQNANGMNFRKEVILDVLSEKPCRVQELLDVCMLIALGSQATLHREIHELVDVGFVACKQSNFDGRVMQLKVTTDGKRYLRKL